MLKMFARGVVLCGGAVAFLASCAGAPDEEAGAGELNGVRSTSYTFSCSKSSCDSCRQEADDRYSECERLCSNPNAPAGCFSQCGSIGDSSCPYACGANESCQELKADLPLPVRDEGLFAACVRYELGCTDAEQKYVDAACDQEARLEQPHFAEEYECITAHACDADGLAHCWTQPEPGTMGTKLCQRAATCGDSCRPGDENYLSDEAFINSIEGRLRPSLVDIARQCAAEESCDKFLACKNALDYLWWLDQHNYFMD